MEFSSRNLQAATLIETDDVAGLEHWLVGETGHPLSEIAVPTLIHHPARSLYDGPLVLLVFVFEVYERWLP